MSWTIEMATKKDIDEIAQLYDDLNDFLNTTVNYAGWKKGVYPTRREAENALKEDGLFVLKIAGKIAGSVAINHRQEEAYSKANWNVKAEGDEVLVVRTLAVHPNFLQQGVANELLQFVKEYAIEKKL